MIYVINYVVKCLINWCYLFVMYYFFCYNKVWNGGMGMKKQKKIKLKGSSFFDKHKPINKKRKSSHSSVKEYSLTKKRPINRIGKSKTVVHKENSRPYSNISKNNTSTRYLPDIVEKRYIFIGVMVIVCFAAIVTRLVQLSVVDTDSYSEKLVAATEPPAAAARRSGYRSFPALPNPWAQ